MKKTIISAGILLALNMPLGMAQDVSLTPSDQRKTLASDTVGQVEKKEQIEWSMFWTAHADGTTLPRVLLIGDSITNQYHNQVDKNLQGIAAVSRLATSKPLGSTLLLKEIEMIMTEYSFDLVHFNNGLHGWSYSEEEYAAALPELYALIRRLAPNAKLIWATTTATHEGDGMKSFQERTARVIERNRISKAFFYDKPVTIDDLYETVSLDPQNYVGGDGTHLNPQGVQKAAEQVSTLIKKLLDK